MNKVPDVQCHLCSSDYLAEATIYLRRPGVVGVHLCVKCVGAIGREIAAPDAARFRDYLIREM